MMRLLTSILLHLAQYVHNHRNHRNQFEFLNSVFADGKFLYSHIDWHVFMPSCASMGPLPTNANNEDAYSIWPINLFHKQANFRLNWYQMVSNLAMKIDWHRANYYRKPKNKSNPAALSNWFFLRRNLYSKFLFCVILSFTRRYDINNLYPIEHMATATCEATNSRDNCGCD